MDINGLLTDLFSRVDEHVHDVLHDLPETSLNTSVVPGTNPIGWLVWHLTRVQDHHVSQLIGTEQVWVTGDWAAECGVSADPENTGYSHDPADVAAIQPASAQLLLDYYSAVAARTREFIATLVPDDLDRIVDRRWNPPVTLGVRLISVADDDIQHAGQAAYARGLLESR